MCDQRERMIQCDDEKQPFYEPSASCCIIKVVMVTTRIVVGSAAKVAWHRVPRASSITGEAHGPIPLQSLRSQEAHPRMLTTTMRAGSNGGGLDVVTLDCTGTIMRIKGSIPRLYLGVLEGRLGVEQGSLPGTISEHNLLAAFGKSMKLRSREFPCFGSGIMSSDEWWGQVVRATYSGAGVRQSDLDGVFDEVFLELFHEVFTGTSAWELVPGAKDVIGDLRAWCDEADGPRALGVISNFDERLHPLLKNLGVHDLFDFVLTSRECGSEKPAPPMFYEALKRAGARNHETGAGVHIGDNFSKDVLGARGVGWLPVLITERGPTSEEVIVEHIRVTELVTVPGALGIESRNR